MYVPYLYPFICHPNRWHPNRDIDISLHKDRLLSNLKKDWSYDLLQPLQWRADPPCCRNPTVRRWSIPWFLCAPLLNTACLVKLFSIHILILGRNLRDFETSHCAAHSSTSEGHTYTCSLCFKCTWFPSILMRRLQPGVPHPESQPSFTPLGKLFKPW